MMQVGCSSPWFQLRHVSFVTDAAATAPSNPASQQHFKQQPTNDHLDKALVLVVVIPPLQVLCRGLMAPSVIVNVLIVLLVTCRKQKQPRLTYKCTARAVVNTSPASTQSLRTRRGNNLQRAIGWRIHLK